MDSHNAKVIRRLAVGSFALMLLGTAGFMQFEDMKLQDAFYETTLILLTHHLHADMHDPAARLLAVLMIIASLGIIAYLLKWLAEYMMGLTSNVRRLRVKKRVEKLKDHYIVCGLGRVGSQVAGEMHHEGVPFIGLDKDPAIADEALAKGFMALPLDSTIEQHLTDVGVERAAGLVACLNDDSLNLFVVLAARSLNPDLYIVSRANREENQVKLKRAGANRVAMPYQIGGYHMASMALRPNVVDFRDVRTKNGVSELEVDEMVVGEQSKMAGHRLGKTLVDEGEVGATVIAINGADGSSRVRPTGREIIYPGDRLIMLGSKSDLTQASELIR
ncbi:MAG: TrkA-N protein [Candidatus Saccharibacteria bacterium]|nr:TrkA-N protein [Candidatus Saccharibacteria bacterium]